MNAINFKPKMDLFNCFLQFILLLFLSIFARARFPETDMIPIAGDVCASVNCGQGTCKASDTLLGYECVCNYGWKRVEIGTIALPFCIVPNCTINFDCGTSLSCPPPFPSAPTPRVDFRVSDPCSLTWCGDGTCVPNGTGYSCKCNADSANLLNSTNLPCLKPCYFGPDCQGLNNAPNLPGQPPSSVPGGPQPPAPPGSRRPNSGPAEVLNGSLVRYVLLVLTLAALITTDFVI